MSFRSVAKLFAVGVLIFGGIFCRAENPPANALHLYINLIQSKGLMDYYDSDNIGDANAQAINNLDWSINGGLRTRRGIRLITTPTTTDLSAENKYLWVSVSTTGTKYLFIKENGEFVVVPIVNNSPTIYSPLGSLPGWRGKADFINVSGVPYIVSDSSRIIKVTEVTPNVLHKFVGLPGSPTGTMVKTHIDRMVVAGSTWPGDDMTIFFSSSSDFDKWPPENFVDLNSEAGQEKITCFGDQIFGNLPVYTNKTTRLATGTEYPDADINSQGNIVYKTISQTIGCANQQTVQTIKNRQLFYSDGQGGNYPGIYEFNGVTVKEKTTAYRHFFKDFVINGSTKPGESPISFVYKDTYCVLVATKTGVVITNTISGAPYSTHNTDCMVCVDENDRIISSRASRVGPFSLDISTGYFLNQTITGGNPTFLHALFYYDSLETDADRFTGGPAETPFSWTYKTKDFPVGDENISRAKVPERIYIKHNNFPGTLGLRANYDFGNSSTTWMIFMSSNYVTSPTGDRRTVLYSSASVINRLSFPVGTKFKYVNFELFGSTPAAVDYLDFYATPEPLP